MEVDRPDRTDSPGLEGTPYRLVREIGRGGMGSVHEVQHRALGKLFVMKVLHENLAHREDFALRMRREWRMLARLEHPAIVQVTDAGRTTEGLPFFVMERLDGQTLGEALDRRGRFPAAEAARIMLTVLSGLEAAHRAGAIHRDIKPQNLFLTARGPKILDFGIAKSKRKGALLVTRNGVAIGTPRYMAPEQAAGLSVDGRADIYACGLVLFEMIAGRDPYAHLKDQMALVGAHISETPPRLDDVRLDAAAPLGDLLARWLAKNPADRPASARLARAELEALLPLLDASNGRADESQAEITWSKRHNDSTAGSTGGSTSLPPSAGSSEISAAFGAMDTVTLDSPSTAVGEPADSALAPSPSVTPPPIARTGGARAPRGSSRFGRWGFGAVALLSAGIIGFAALVLRPDLSSRLSPRPEDSLLGAAAYEFPETPTPAPAPTAAVAEQPSASQQRLDEASPQGLERSSRDEMPLESAARHTPETLAAARPTQASPSEPRPSDGPPAVPDSALPTAAPAAGPASSPARTRSAPAGVELGQGQPSQPAVPGGPPPPGAAPADLPGSGLW